MAVRYKPNEQDKSILEEITGTIRRSVEEWYGSGATLDAGIPEVRSYKNCFIFRYPITTSEMQKKHILVKVRRNPKMDSLSQAIQADIHWNMNLEYTSIKFLYDYFTQMQADFGAIRPLLFMEQFPALVMEEYPSRSLRQLLIHARSSKSAWSGKELKDAARKTGRLLYYFHHHLHTPVDKPYTVSNILDEVREYARQIESYSRGRVRSAAILDSFSRKLENIQIEHVTFSLSHADMTIDNVLYSDDGSVCLIDIKNRFMPIYVDLGLILIHPETSKLQIFSAGTYYPESLLASYRAEIVAGYFEEEAGDEVLVRIYSALKVLDKWLMYEELIRKYKGMKRALSIAAGPLVSVYFQNLLKKYLDMIGDGEPGKAIRVDKTTVDTSF